MENKLEGDPIVKKAFREANAVIQVKLDGGLG